MLSLGQPVHAKWPDLKGECRQEGEHSHQSCSVQGGFFLVEKPILNPPHHQQGGLLVSRRPWNVVGTGSCGLLQHHFFELGTDIDWRLTSSPGTTVHDIVSSPVPALENRFFDWEWHGLVYNKTKWQQGTLTRWDESANPSKSSRWSRVRMSWLLMGARVFWIHHGKPVPWLNRLQYLV